MKKSFFFISILFNTLVLFSCSHGEPEKSSEEAKAEIYYNYGTSNLVAKNYTEALKNFLEALKLNPNDSKTHNNIGMTYHFKKQRQLCLFHLNKSLQIDPKNSSARNNLASAYFLNGELDKAEIEYNIILKELTYEQQYRVYYNLGLIKLKKGFNRDAQEYFVNSIKEKDDYCPAHFKLGELFFQIHKYDDAYDHFHSASLGSCYKEELPQYYQALTLLKLKRLPEAKLKFIELYKQFPKSDNRLQIQQRLSELKDVDVDKVTTDKVSQQMGAMKRSESTNSGSLIDFTKENKQDTTKDKTYVNPKF